MIESSLRGTAAACLLSVASLAQSGAPPQTTIFENARVITGNEGAPIERGAIVVERGRIVRVGAAADVKAPAGAVHVDLAGKTVMPMIVDAHVHLGYQVGTVFSADNYTRATLVDQLRRYEYAGIAAVMSLGTDPPPLPNEIRAEQAADRLDGARLLFAGRGIAAPNAGPGTPELKASAYGVTTEEEARRAVREQIQNRVDIIKIWVDDRNGTVQKLSPALYRAVIDEAHKRGMRVIAHVFYLDDAKDLARAGIDAFAHLVRDREVDDELVSLITARKIVVMPNMAISENGIYTTPPAWLDDPLLRDTTPGAVLERVRASYLQRTPEAAARARLTWTRMQNTMAKLSAARVPLVLGTDDGAVRDHFYAFTAHRELKLMTDAGLKPADVLTIATKRTAEFLRLNDYGTLEPGKRGDFLVLDANPLDDIVNTRTISAVYRHGKAVDRRRLAAGFR